MELPKTEEELQLLIDKKLEETKEAHKKELNELAYKLRKEGDDKLSKYKQEQSLSDEERAKKLAEEKEKALNDELAELRSYKKNATLKERLTKEGMPTYLANDSRLINASDDELDKAIKIVKADYEGSLPKGNTRSSVIPTNSGVKPTDKGNDNGREELAEQLKDMFK